MILLGLRTAVNSDTKVSSAQLTVGSELRLPGEFYADEDHSPMDAPEFVRKMDEAMRSFTLKSRRHGESPVYVPAMLSTCSHVFLRVDTQKASLVRPYTGPYPVLGRDDKTVTIEKGGKRNKVSIDRCKPAHILDEKFVPRSVDVVPPPVWVKKSEDSPPPPPIRRGLPRRVRFQGKYTK